MGIKRPWISAYIPAFKRRRTGWGLNSGWRKTFGYKTRRTSYMPRYRRRSNFNVKKLRARRRVKATKKGFTTIFRDTKTLTPDGTGKLLFCSYVSEANFKYVKGYTEIFDEYKIVKLYQKFRVEKSARVENDEDDVDIIHWSCYDPDAKSKTFTGLTDFHKCDNSKWHIMKPYQVRTSTLSPVFNDNTNITDYGIRSVNNPWFDVANWKNIVSINGVQHLWIGPYDPNDVTAVKYKIVCEQTVKVSFRGLRQGQQYK